MTRPRTQAETEAIDFDMEIIPNDGCCPCEDCKRVRRKVAAWRDSRPNDRPLVVTGQGAYRREYSPEPMSVVNVLSIACIVAVVAMLVAVAWAGGVK